jgi:hypothetical protein
LGDARHCGFPRLKMFTTKDTKNPKKLLGEPGVSLIVAKAME